MQKLHCWAHSHFSSTVTLLRATSSFPDPVSSKTAIDAPPAPISQVFVTITQQEHIELRLVAKQWQGLHSKAVARFDQQEVHHDRIVREIKAQALKSNTALRVELDCALAQVAFQSIQLTPRADSV
jgi:hypothetical protein